MISRLMYLVTPLYLFLCVLFGGSSQGIWGILTLQLLGILILVWAALTKSPDALSESAKTLWIIVVASVGLVLVQLIPLPPSTWALLPGRAPVVQGFNLTAIELPWLPLSLAPYDTIAALLMLLPPIAILLGVLRLGAFRSGWLSLSLVAAALAGVLLGTVQVTAGEGYLYKFTSTGQAAGFFANANYMGTLLLSATPFAAALCARALKQRRPARRSLGLLTACLSGLVVLLLGLALNHSAAALLLSLPVLLASAALLPGNSRRSSHWLLGGALAALALGGVAFGTTPSFSQGENAVSVSTRKDIYARSLSAAADTFPVGSGLGTFPAVYPRYEDPERVDYVFVNHAHNDYLEIGMELGLPGLILLALFLLWWSRRAVHIWSSEESSGVTRAATIASAAILAHSLVDFPARTSAIAAVLAASIALMAEPRPRRAFVEHGFRGRPARHLSIP